MDREQLQTNSPPPTPFVRHVAGMLDFGTPLDVLDVGCGIGKSSIYLAKLGHNVIGLNNEFSELKEAQEYFKAFPNISCQFVVGDARRLMFKKKFDIVMANEVLHQMPKTDAKDVIRLLQKITKPGGIHAVSDYIGSKENALNGFELFDLYRDPNWEIIEYQEDEELLNPIGELVSQAKIIATLK